MKFLVFILCILCFEDCTCQSNPHALKDGEYYILGEEDVRIRIEGSIQVEEFNDGRSYIKSKIDWKNERTYTLRIVSIHNFNSKSPCVQVGQKIRVDVVEQNGDDMFICESSTKSCGKDRFALMLKRRAPASQ